MNLPNWNRNRLVDRSGSRARANSPKGLRGLVLLSAAIAAGCGGLGWDREPVLPEGEALAEQLDAMHVESHWIAGRHVDWRTGEPDGRHTPVRGHHSHCSAFVAAVAVKLGVDILHPPEHSQVLLADAQCNWLANEGVRVGWRAVETPLDAQRLANRGEFVLACYESPDPSIPGHIAVVRPAAISRRRIESEGPQVAQAGIENFRSTTLARGFRHHARAWTRRAVRFYCHESVFSKH